MAAKKARVYSVKKNLAERSSKRRERLETARGMYAAISPERVLSDELIQERRREASRESALSGMREDQPTTRKSTEK